MFSFKDGALKFPTIKAIATYKNILDIKIIVFKLKKLVLKTVNEQKEHIYV